MVYPRIEIIKHKGKMRLNPETGDRFRQRDVRKKDNWVFDHYNMGVILNNGFVGEQWRSLKNIIQMLWQSTNFNCPKSWMVKSQMIM